MDRTYYQMSQEELDEDITLNLKKIFYIVWSRKILMAKVFISILVFFIVLTFILPKKWTVTTDLYISKTNSTNYFEINPYAMEDVGGLSSVLGNSDPLANDIELIQSPKVIDKVIVENDLKFKKLFGFIPTSKTGEYLTTEKFLKKGVDIETKKGTNVLRVSYTNKDRDIAYNVVVSIINNYIDLYKEINSERSKSDTRVIESEYQKAKADLNKKVNTAGGLPTTSMSGTGQLAAMSAFSRSAQNAMSTLRGQYIAGEKARVEITEEASKVSQLANKLEWARLVEEMSDSSKVLVIKEPYPLRDWEYSSPKLLINILLGIVFGAIFSLMALIYAERSDKKLSYSMLGDNIIYDLNEEIDTLAAEVMSNVDDKKAFIFFEEVPTRIADKFKQFENTIFLKADISNEFTESIKNVDTAFMFASISRTGSAKYKLVKKMISNLGKKIHYEVLV